jgi:hypothetical protein
MLFPHPSSHFIGGGASAINKFLPAGIVTIPDLQPALAQEILVVKP